MYLDSSIRSDFFSGNSLNAQYTHFLQAPVPPGETVDLTVDMVAPEDIGLYQSNWMLSDPDGALFGIGPHGDAPFWVRIEVIIIATDTPTPTPTATLTRTPVYTAADEVDLGDGDQLDLDIGELNPDEEDEADLLYAYGGTPTHLLTPINDTTWGAYGETEPSLTDCTGEELTSNGIAFNEVPDGTYYCYQTSQGRRGWLLFEDFAEDQLTVSFLTWSAP